MGSLLQFPQGPGSATRGDTWHAGRHEGAAQALPESVRRRIAKNADNPAWKTIEGNWLALVEHARAELSSYKQGAIHIRQHCLAYEEIVKLANDVTPAEVVHTPFLLYLMAEQEPRRFPVG